MAIPSTSMTRQRYRAGTAALGMRPFARVRSRHDGRAALRGDRRRCPGDDQSARAAQRDVVRRDERPPRRDGERPGRRRRAGRRAHRRGRQGVLRGRRSHRHRRERGCRGRARGTGPARRSVPRHVVAGQADRGTGARLRARRWLRPRVRVRSRRRRRRRGVRDSGDQRRLVAVHDHGAAAAVDAAQDRARPDDDRPARLGRRRRAHRLRAAGRARRRASTRRSTRSRPSSRRSRR